MNQAIQQARFRHMRNGAPQDWQRFAEHSVHYVKRLPNRLLDHRRLLDDHYGGFPVDRLTHSLQTATPAHKDGQDEEYVVCVLLREIGNTLGSFNPANVAAAMQSATLAIVIATSILENTEMSIPGAIYGLVMCVGGAVLVILVRSSSKNAQNTLEGSQP